jgi:hypothetical protein
MASRAAPNWPVREAREDHRMLAETQDARDAA